MHTSTFVLALFFGGAEAIKVLPTPIACVSVNKETGMEQACDAAGNSAWVPDKPLANPSDLGWKKRI